MSEYLDYYGGTPMPGATAQQDYAIDLALRVITADYPQYWEVLKRAMLVALNCNGGVFTDEQMRQALRQVIRDNAPFLIPEISLCLSVLSVTFQNGPSRLRT